MKRESFLEFDSLALDLFFCSEILGLSSLHYGLWSDPSAEPLTLENLRRAQARYTEALCDLIPEGTRRVLDVGCGLGDVSRCLASRGYQVTAISPDKNHGRYLRRLDPKVRFIQARYQTLEPVGEHDLVLMSESQNYFQADTCFAQTARHLSLSGHLLVSGMFRREGSEPFPDHVNRIDEFLARGEAAGFELSREVDITERVLPTLRMVHGALEEYVEPTIELLTRFMLTSAPLKTRVITWLFKKQLDEFDSIHRYLLTKLDPALFEQKACYRMLLFRRAAAARVA